MDVYVIKREDSRGMFEGTGRATRLRKSRKKKNRGMCESTGWATRKEERQNREKI